MKIIKGVFGIILFSLLTGCGSPDPDVEFLIQDMVKDGDVSESDARCFAKGFKKGMDKEGFVAYMDIKKKETTDIGDMGILMEALPVIMGVSIKCGIPLE
jgi:hypothetical protein